MISSKHLSQWEAVQSRIDKGIEQNRKSDLAIRLVDPAELRDVGRDLAAIRPRGHLRREVSEHLLQIRHDHALPSQRAMRSSASTMSSGAPA